MLKSNLNRHKSMHAYCFDDTEAYGTKSFKPMAEETTSNAAAFVAAFAQQYVDTQNWTDEEYKEFVRKLEKGRSNDREAHTDRSWDWRMEHIKKRSMKPIWIHCISLSSSASFLINFCNKEVSDICLPFHK